MSNKRIELSGTVHVRFADENLFEDNERNSWDYSKCDVLALCEYNTMNRLPRFVTRCITCGIKPLCGVSFHLETPENCLTRLISIVCYAENEYGTEELEYLCYHCDDGEIKYEDFCNHSKHLQVGLSLIFDEASMLAIENIFDTVFIPDFIVIAAEQCGYRSWKICEKFFEERSIPVCGGAFIMDCSVDDEIIIKEDFAPYGDKAYEYVIENPRKIADRISGNYKFDIALIESIEKKITGGRRRL